MAEPTFDRQRAAAAFRALAGEFNAIRANESNELNEPGFVVRMRALERFVSQLRALQLRAAECGVDALEAGVFDDMPGRSRLRGEVEAQRRAAAGQESNCQQKQQEVFLLAIWRVLCREFRGFRVAVSQRALALATPEEFASETRSMAADAAFVCERVAEKLESKSARQDLADEDRSAADAAPEAPAAVKRFATATDAVPREYCEEGRPCGPLEGNLTDCVNALKRVKKPRRADLLKLHQSGRVWVRQIEERLFEVFFRSFADRDRAAKKLSDNRPKRTQDEAKSGD